MTRGGANKQIINLPGTRVDTLYTTIETGTDDNGVEWEKRQATAPRTFEEAITDDNGIILSEKIADILERIGQLSGGEYDVLLQEIEDIKQEIAGLDLTQWHHVVPFGKDIVFAAQDGDVAKRGIIGKDASNNLLLMNNNTTFMRLGENTVDVTKQMIHKRNILFPYDYGIYFGIQEQSDAYLMYTSIDKKLYINFRKPDGNLTNGGLEYIGGNRFKFKDTIWADNGIVISGGGMLSGNDYWNAIGANCPIAVPTGSKDDNEDGGLMLSNSQDSYSHFHKIKEENETGSLIFINGNNIGGWNQSAYIDTTSTWHFNKPIAAPNMASIASVLAAEREITEQDIRLIESQQEITEMDLKIMELETKINKITGGETIE